MTTRTKRPAPRPPEGTPPPAELARQARAVLAGAARLARWADGAALRAGPDGALPKAAAERAAEALGLTPQQVRADWDRARLAGLVELHDGLARPGWRLRAWDRDDTAVLRGWVALFDAWSLARPAPPGAGPALVAEVVEARRSCCPCCICRPARSRCRSCSTCWTSASPSCGRNAARSPTARTRPRAARTMPRWRPTTPRGRRSAELLDWALDALLTVGALVPPDGAHDGGYAAAHDASEAQLTPLGNWAVWVKLEQICVAAQGPAGHIEQSAEAMLRGCARLSPGPARAEYRAWLAARSVGAAVEELLTVARGEDALLRGLAFEALRAVGAPAEPAVRAAVDEPGLRPYALLWLAEHEGGDPETAPDVLTREEATWLWVDTAAAVADHGETQLLVRHLETAVQGSVPRLLDGGTRHRPPPHRPGAGGTGRGPPRPGARQGGTPRGVPGPHRWGLIPRFRLSRRGGCSPFVARFAVRPALRLRRAGSAARGCGCGDGPPGPVCGTASLYVPHTGPSGPSPPVSGVSERGWGRAGVSTAGFRVRCEVHRTTYEHPHRPFPTPQREGTGRSGWVCRTQSEAVRTPTRGGPSPHPDSPAQRTGPPQAQRRESQRRGAEAKRSGPARRRRNAGRTAKRASNGEKPPRRER